MAKAPIHSMTGFSRIRRRVSGDGVTEGEVMFSLRSVNHRGLDLHFHLPAEFDPFESALRRALGASVRRGHVDVRVHFERSAPAGAAALNRPMLEAWIAAFRSAAQEFSIAGEPDLNVALRVPGMVGDGAAEEPGQEFEAALLAVAAEAIVGLNVERSREGAQTAAVLASHGAAVETAVAEMESIRASISAHLKTRLEDRLKELLSGANLEPARLAQEAALLADRSDVSEETARLRIHSERLAELLGTGGEVGKKIEFLSQEMHREANTILSKSNAAGEPGRRLSELALAVKSEVEKIREQSLNLE
ncbi:MAG: YicC/YloC family endoribonuclease [Bryobacteraceae bacterium]